jgi:hypothetical protein
MDGKPTLRCVPSQGHPASPGASSSVGVALILPGFRAGMSLALLSHMALTPEGAFV